MRENIAGFLCRLRLRLHARRHRVQRVVEGVTFLGFRLLADRSRLVRGNVVGFRRRLRWMQREYAAGRMDWEAVHRRVQAWIAHAAHGNTRRLRAQILGTAVFCRGGAA
jgi:hypothetical protein